MQSHFNHAIAAVNMPGRAQHMTFSSYLCALRALLFKSFEIVKGNTAANVVHSPFSASFGLSSLVETCFGLDIDCTSR